MNSINKTTQVLLIFVSALFLFDVQTAEAQGRLGSVRNNVRSEQTAPAREPRSSSSSNERSRQQNQQSRQREERNNNTDDQADDSGSVMNAIRASVRRHDNDSNNGHSQGGNGHHDHNSNRDDRRGRRHRRHHHNNRFGVSFYQNNCAPAFYPTPISTACVTPAPVLVPPCYEPVVQQPVIFAEPQPIVVVTEPAPLVAPVEIPPAVTAPVEVVAPVVGQNYFDRNDEFSWWTVRMTAHYGNDFDGVGQGGLSILLQNPGGIGLDTSVTMLRERGTGWRDHLWIGDANLVYEFNEGIVRSRIGIGVNWLGDRFGGEAGFNLTGGMDWQLTPGTTFTGEIDFGSLADADFLHARAALSSRISGNTELMVGYDYYDIGGTEIGSLVTGFTFRF